MAFVHELPHLEDAQPCSTGAGTHGALRRYSGVLTGHSGGTLGVLSGHDAGYSRGTSAVRLGC
jgi:hypothetical protein